MAVAVAIGVLLLFLNNYYFDQESLKFTSHSNLELLKKETALQSEQPASARKTIFGQGGQDASQDVQRLDNYPDIVAYFQEAALQNGWSETELIGNLRHWKDVCQKAEKISVLPKDKKAKSSKFIPMMRGHERLAAFCGAINAPEQELLILDNLEKLLEIWEKGGNYPENPDSPYVKLRHSLERAKTPEQVERLIFPENRAFASC